ncbi:DUF3616 domain-containing protein [Pararhizobium gei]|uniref:DUF3616 domain-containing protein n=1 Tax=Pararhizobium gei TaxID=1395951 RepID=UPI0023DA75E6|nr:DUF3616 domain-containing protein [Rhizobium gei]
MTALPLQTFFNASAQPGQSEPFLYSGLFEASAATALEHDHFVVASDEINRLQIYRRGTSGPVGSVQLKKFIGSLKSDIEASARIGRRIYWITSHSRKDGSKGGAKKRSVLFATKIGGKGGPPKLRGVGTPHRKLRKAIRNATGIEPRHINIEGLADTSEGMLLIGFRSPLASNGNALVLPLKNPAAVTQKGRSPRFGKLLELDLGGLGIRSIDRLDMADASYLILAGPQTDEGDRFALYSWTGGTEAPVQISELKINDFKAEALVFYPESRTIQILSDDGTAMHDDEKTPEQERRFRSIDMHY